MKAEYNIKNLESIIAQKRTIRKYLMHETTQQLLANLELAYGRDCWVSDYGTIWVTLIDQPGFTFEANPKLFQLLESLFEHTNWYFKNVELGSRDAPEELQRIYTISFRWRGQEFSIVVNCHLAPDSETCIRVQTGTKTISQSKWTEQEVEVPVYEFKC